MPDNSPLAVRLCNVSVDLGQPPVRVLDRISLDLQRGEFISIVGPSGCGKSTLLRVLGRLLPPTNGSLEFCAESTGEPLRTSFVFQHPNLLPWRNVLGNISLPEQLAGCDRRQTQGKAVAACRLVGLDARDARKLPRMLSGGMQMRVSLARALMTEPALMLLDEPFAAIDDILRQQLNQDVLRLWLEQQWTSVFVTHHLHEALFLAQRIVVMSTKPARITGQFTVPFPYPRDRSIRTSVEFARLLEDVDSCLRTGSV